MTWLAWLAPWLFGIGLWMLVCSRPRNVSDGCAMLGGGWLLGALVIGMALPLVEGVVSPQASVRVLGPWLLGAGIVMGAVAWRWRRGEAPMPESPLATCWRALIVVLLLLLAARFAWMWQQATLLPLFPWDAWTTWSVKPAVWFQLDRWVPFADYTAWLRGADPQVFTSEAVGYPGWLGRLEVWYAAGMGCWCDPAFTRLWPALWVALLLVTYGLLRRLGTHLPVAVGAVYALGSLPLLDVHAAMAGYVDLWLAAFLAVGMLLWLTWQQQRARARGVLGLLMILALPALKLEGGVWMLLALAVMILGLLSASRRRQVGALVGGVGVVLLLGLIFGGWPLPLPGIGVIHVAADGLHVPGREIMQLGWHPVAGPALQSLFVVSSWHLLFFVAVAWIPLRWRKASAGVGLLGLLLLAALLFLFALFFFTNAAAWAEDFTGIGRLILQAVPLLVCYLALLAPQTPRAGACVQAMETAANPVASTLAPTLARGGWLRSPRRLRARRRPSRPG